MKLIPRIESRLDQTHTFKTDIVIERLSDKHKSIIYYYQLRKYDKFPYIALYWH